MTFDAIESNAFAKNGFNVSEQLSKLHAGFDNTVSAVNGAYENLSASLDDNVANWLGEEPGLKLDKTTVYDKVKQMYSGVKESDGKKTLGLKEISNRKINPDTEYANVKQHSGFSAEVISTTKENLKAELDGSGVRTYRADDRPDLFSKNDMYVDKIRVDANGNIIDRIQTKFVGGNADECYRALKSKEFDRYIEDGKVNKLEIPKDYYKDVKASIANELKELETEHTAVEAKGDSSALKSVDRQISHLKKMDDMLEQSTVTSDEAVYATRHPERYVSKLMAEEVVKTSATEGLRAGATAAALTCTVSTIDNVQKVMSGEITPEEAAVNVTKDTALAGGVGFATQFVSSAVTQSMSASSHTLIRSISNAGIPAAAITMAISSYDSIIDYAQGTIDESELAKDLGKNAVNIAGSAAGSAAVGAIYGSVVPGAGTAVGGAVGFAAGIAGGMVGTAVASEAYETALEYGPEVAQGFADKAQEMATQTVEVAQKYVPNKVESIKTALNTYINTNNLPIKI